MKKLLVVLAAVAAVLSGCKGYQSVKGDPMQARIYTLDNGLKVYMSVNREEPRIQTYVAINVGGKDDPADNTGLAHYLEHMMFKGTELFGTQDYEAEKPMLEQIDSLFEVYRTLTDPAEREALYAKIDSVSYEASKIAIPNEYDKLMSMIGADGTNAFTSNDVTCYVDEIPSNRVDTWARIAADRFKYCVFRGFHTELEAVYEEKNMGLTSDGEKAIDSIDSMLFVHHPYGTQTVIGTQEHLKNPSLKAIRYQKDTYYVPNNAAICLSGDFDPDEVIGIIKKYFGDWKPNPSLPTRTIADEDPIESPKVKEVLGDEAEFVLMGWRTPGTSSREGDIAELVCNVLYNGQAGIVDSDLIRPQAILGGGFFNYDRTDWGMVLAEAMPKEGQSLEQAKDLLLSSLEKLRSGDFPEEILQAAKANYKLERQKALVSNRARTSEFMDAFISGRSWKDMVEKQDRLDAVTKDDVVAWAHKYLGAENYAIVYKRIGEDKSIKKIDAPKITPIVTNRDKQSAFLAAVAAEEVTPIEPQWVDYGKDLTVSRVGDLDLLYKHNSLNDVASLSFRYDKGTSTDPVLAIASDYWTYLDSEAASADEFALAQYCLACDVSLRVGENTSALNITGLGENIEESLSTAEKHLAGLAPSEEILQELKADIVRSRADSKKNQRACNSALRKYVTYGPEAIKRGTITNAALGKLSTAKVLESLQSLLGSSHTVLYYGPASLEEVTAMLERVHKTEGLTPLEKTRPVKRLTPSKQVYVAHYPSRQFNYMQYSDRGETLDLSQDALIDLFNEYYGGGMNAIVFQEMRESRALAYGAGAWLSGPEYIGDTYSFRAYIASQNDKLRKAVEGFDEIIETLPLAPENLEIAKNAILAKLRTSRVRGERVLYSYLTARELGIEEPRDKAVFQAVDSLTLEDLVATHEKWIKGRTYNYAVLGDTADMDMRFLRSLGPVKILTLEEVFGY